jgi:glycosyltransferase involved in cell wall biosynthesis
MKQKSPAISIIIPVYNVEQYLSGCLESIIAQTYKDIEVYLIDDGSKDLSGIICDRYASVYPYIHVYHQDHGGVVSARDRGVCLAKGEYLAFIDADDWVEPNYLQRFMENQERYDPDIVITGYRKDTEDKSRAIVNCIEAGIYEKEKLVPFYKKMLQYNDSYAFGVEPFLVNKLFRRELFMRYASGLDPKIYEAEDAAIVFPYLLHCRRIVVTEDCLYHYVYRKSSATNNRTFNYFENISRLFLYLNRRFQETEYYDIMLPQLGPYMRMLIYIENPEAFAREGRYMFPFKRVPVGSRIILYGAGNLGKIYHHQVMLSQFCRIAAWVDAAYSKEELRQLGVREPQAVKEEKYDYIVIAIENRAVISHVEEALLEMGVPKERIVFANELQ